MKSIVYLTYMRLNKIQSVNLIVDSEYQILLKPDQ
jgi:hypothetical protein